MLSASNSCNYNENSKNGKNCLQKNARPSGPTPTNPRPRAKRRMQKPRSGGKFSVQIPGGALGVVLAKIDSCITMVVMAKIDSFLNNSKTPQHNKITFCDLNFTPLIHYFQVETDNFAQKDSRCTINKMISFGDIPRVTLRRLFTKIIFLVLSTENKGGLTVA